MYCLGRLNTASVGSRSRTAGRLLILSLLASGVGGCAAGDMPTDRQVAIPEMKSEADLYRHTGERVMLTGALVEQKAGLFLDCGFKRIWLHCDPAAGPGTTVTLVGQLSRQHFAAEVDDGIPKQSFGPGPFDLFSLSDCARIEKP